MHTFPCMFLYKWTNKFNSIQDYEVGIVKGWGNGKFW